MAIMARADTWSLVSLIFFPVAVAPGRLHLCYASNFMRTANVSRNDAVLQDYVHGLSKATALESRCDHGRVLAVMAAGIQSTVEVHLNAELAVPLKSAGQDQTSFRHQHLLSEFATRRVMIIRAQGSCCV